jgi:hypothetical protein
MNSFTVSSLLVCYGTGLISIRREEDIVPYSVTGFHQYLQSDAGDKVDHDHFLILPSKSKGKVEISLLQAVEAHRVARG